VGRNARQNDELTLRVARGNDLFLHVAGRAGGHVIVRSPTGKPPPTETLLDAANLALYYSLPDRQRRGQAISAGGEVDYTQVKYVRKPKGAKPGLLLLASRKTLRIRLELERLERLRRQLEELEAPPPGN
jgi:predicted ribosome quality control (RQC) complex YloA/Tae2 family protein